MAQPRTGNSQRVLQFELHGKVVSGNRTMYAVDGEDIEIDVNTWIIGVLKIGSFAKVRGIVQSGVGKYATKITIS